MKRTPTELKAEASSVESNDQQSPGRAVGTPGFCTQHTFYLAKRAFQFPRDQRGLCGSMQPRDRKTEALVAGGFPDSPRVQ